MEIGLIVFLVLAIMGGAIAYIGDRLGFKVGKKKVSLFGLRPRHTSVLVAIVTGMMISLLTIGIMSILSENVRTALFGMEALNARMTALNAEVEQKSAELEQGKKQLEDKNEEYEKARIRLSDAHQELAEAERQEQYMRDQLAVTEAAYAKAKADIQTSAKEIEELENTRLELTENIDKLHVEAERLRTNIVNIREGQVVFRVGEILSSAVVESGLTEEEAKQVIACIANDTNHIFQERFHASPDTNLIRVLPQEIERAAKEISGMDRKKLVRVVAAGNIIVGEPAWVQFVIYDNALIYHRGDVIWQSDLTSQDDITSIEVKVLRFLREVNEKAQEKGVLPDPITGNVGQVDGKQLFATIQEISRANGQVNIRAVAKQDVYTEGPVAVDIVVTRK